MKKITFCLLLFLLSIGSSFQLHAQLTEVISIDNPYGIAVNGDFLYIARDNEISKLDITQTDPEPVVLSTDVLGPDEIIIKGDFLYVADYLGNKISKINLTESDPILIDVLNGVDEILALALRGDELYFSYNDNGNKIAKINITETNPTIVEVVDGIQKINDLFFNGDELYISTLQTTSGGENKIYKINVTDPDLILTEIITDIEAFGLSIRGNYLYFSQYDINENKISKIDLTETAPTPIDVVTVETPYYLKLVENDLYISTIFNDKIYKYEHGPLSINQESKRLISVVPNPAFNYLTIDQLLEPTEYKIFNSLGQEVKSGVLLPTKRVDIQKLNVGNYFLQLKNSKAVKFIKKIECFF